MAYETIRVTPMTPNIGGLVENIDLTEPLGPRTVEDLHDALMVHVETFVINQELPTLKVG